jgi:hypothetical protein
MRGGQKTRPGMVIPGNEFERKAAIELIFHNREDYIPQPGFPS